MADETNEVVATATVEATQSDVTTPIEEKQPEVVDTPKEVTSDEVKEAPAVDENTDTGAATEEVTAETSSQEQTSPVDSNIQTPPEPQVQQSGDTVADNLNLQIQILDNVAQQEYLKLCNQYGVNFKPEAIEKSVEELKARDPQAFIDFNLRLQALHNDFTDSKANLQRQLNVHEVTGALNTFKPLLDNSPVTNRVIHDFLGQIELIHPKQQVEYILKNLTDIYAEAFNQGVAYGKTNKAAMNDPSKELNNSVMSNNPSTTAQPTKTFTREQISKMSLDEFAKNEKLITDLMKQGLIK